MATDSIKISIELADKAAKKGLSDFISKGDQADKGMKKLGETGSSAFQEIGIHVGKATGIYDIFAGNLAANIATKAFDVLAGSAKFLFDTLVVDGVKSAQESEDALNSLNVSLGQAGIYSKETSKFFQDFANEIQNVTTLDDDLVIKNAALIESMTRLSKEGLAQATNAAIQLSAAFNIDLDTASRNVAKAVDGNVTALKKLGLDFEVTGTKAGTYANVLKSIENLNGSAESKVNTFSGSVAHAGNAFDDFRKEIGLVITQNPVFITAINKVSQILGSMSLGVSDSQKSIMSLVGNGFIGLINGSKYVTQAFDFMISGIRIAFNSLQIATIAMAGSVLSLIAPFSDSIKSIISGMVEQAHESEKVIKDVFNNGSLGGVISTLDGIGKAAEEGMGKLQSGITNTEPVIKNATSALSEFTEEQSRGKKEIDSYVESLAKQADSIKTNYDQQLEQLNTFYVEKEVSDTVADETNYSLKIEREAQFYTDKQAARDASLNAELQTIQQSSVAEDTKLKASIAAQNKYFSDSQKMALEHDQKDKKLKEDKKKYDEQMDQYKLSSTASLFGALGQAAALGGKKNFEIVKAFNLAEAVTAGWLSVQKALASGPPPWNGVAAAAAGIAAAANVSRISSTRAPAYEQGGIVGGTSWSGDKVQARVNSGEMILNRQQQTKLFEVANNGSSGSGRMEQMLAMLIDAVRNQSTSINIDGREIINVVRQGLNNGRTLT